MRYGQIREYDIANGIGVRSVIFVTGCTHKCPGCFNELYQDFSYGEIWTDEQTELVIKYLKNPVIEGLTILGGEPLQNVKKLTEIVKKIKKQVKKSIWIYSGYTFDEILTYKDKLELVKLCDVLVDGRFWENKKSPLLRFRGSSNQRIIDIQKTLASDTPTQPILFNLE